MDQSPVPLGIWKSSYTYPSSGRGQEFEGHHFVRAHQKDNHLIFESAAETSKSYLIVRLSIEDNVATGSWQEQTDPSGYYKGVTYYGALQLVVSDGGKDMKGKWVGFGKDMKVNVGSWELSYVGTSLPESAIKEHAIIRE